MGSPKIHRPVKLFYGILFNDIEKLSAVREKLRKEHGVIDSESEIYDFNFTDYYRREMGESIKRIFLSFDKLIDPEELSHIKLKSNELEKAYSNDCGHRQLNLDPGYLTAAKVVLASAKDNIQRLYIGNGIYEEITLFYKHDTFNAFEWTFPDYRNIYIPYFNSLRKKYIGQLKSLR